MSGDVLQVSDGSLYPALHKLEKEGWISSAWQATESNRRAKFYDLTSAGRLQLDRETAQWERLSSAVSQIVAVAKA
jgi:DNA-binding PadR family transcriptional regulator